MCRSSAIPRPSSWRPSSQAITHPTTSGPTWRRTRAAGRARSPTRCRSGISQAGPRSGSS
jgi:hypothetical protein